MNVSPEDELKKLLDPSKKEIIKIINDKFNKMITNLDDKTLNMPFITFQYLLNKKYTTEITIKNTNFLRKGSFAYKNKINQTYIFKENSSMIGDFSYLNKTIKKENKKNSLKNEENKEINEEIKLKNKEKINKKETKENKIINKENKPVINNEKISIKQENKHKLINNKLSKENEKLKEDEVHLSMNQSEITESLTINFMNNNYGIERVGNTKRIKEFTKEVKKLISKYL